MWYIRHSIKHPFLDFVIVVLLIWLFQSCFRLGFHVLFQVVQCNQGLVRICHCHKLSFFHAHHMMLSHIMLSKWFISTYMLHYAEISFHSFFRSHSKTSLARSRNVFDVLTDEYQKPALSRDSVPTNFYFRNWMRMYQNLLKFQIAAPHELVLKVAMISFLVLFNPSAAMLLMGFLRVLKCLVLVQFDGSFMMTLVTQLKWKLTAFSSLRTFLCDWYVFSS